MIIWVSFPPWIIVSECLCYPFDREMLLLTHDYDRTGHCDVCGGLGFRRVGPVRIDASRRAHTVPYLSIVFGLPSKAS